jgi:hypothetical protein
MCGEKEMGNYKKGWKQASAIKKAEAYQPTRLMPLKSSVMRGMALAMIVYYDQNNKKRKHEASKRGNELSFTISKPT